MVSYLYIYIYIYVCACVCVCVQGKEAARVPAKRAPPPLPLRDAVKLLMRHNNEKTTSACFRSLVVTGTTDTHRFSADLEGVGGLK